VDFWIPLPLEKKLRFYSNPTGCTIFFVLLKSLLVQHVSDVTASIDRSTSSLQP
jgi:hypothetical protein